MSQTKEFTIAARGLATSYPASNTPPEYCAQFRNLYINTAGNCEVRQGLSRFSSIDTANTITQLHEFITASGTTLLFASGGGRIWRYNTSAATWTQVYVFPGATANAPIIYSYAMSGRIIFYDGTHRSVFTTDGTSFLEQRSILEVGRATAGVSGNALVDSTVLNWVTTDVAQYDLVYYTNLSAYGLVTSVVSARLNHTPVSAGATGLGLSPGGEPVATSPYQVIDMVELNIIPVSGQSEPDNMGSLAAGSTTSAAAVNFIVDHTGTAARLGDIVYNSTRNRVAEITSMVTAAFIHTEISAQAAGDEVVLLKSSMPITKDAHVHFSRAYLVDAREPHKIRISGPNNSQDLGGRDAATLDITTLQPTSEIIKSVTSYQRFFIIGGSRNIFIFEGTEPVATSAEAKDFSILGSFPTGVLSRDALKTAGNECLFVTNTGIQSTTLRKASSQLEKKQASAQLDKTLRDLLKVVPEIDIQMVHYPRRSWMLTKCGSELYVYNYSVAAEGLGGSDSQLAQLFGGGDSSTLTIEQEKIAWHVFDGPLAQQRCYLVRANGDLLTGSAQGALNIFDQGVYQDLSAAITINYTSAWDTVTTDNKRVRALPKIARKRGHYIRPYFEAGAVIPVTIKAVAPFQGYSSDTVVVTAGEENTIGIAQIGDWEIGEAGVTNPKVPLRWNGEQVQISFEAEISAGPCLLSSFVVGYLEADAA